MSLQECCSSGQTPTSEVAITITPTTQHGSLSSRSTKTGFLENKTLKSRRVLVFLQLRSSHLRGPSLSQSVWTLLYLPVVVRAQHQLCHPTMHQVRATKLLLKSCHTVKMAFPLSAGFLQEERLTYPPPCYCPHVLPQRFCVVVAKLWRRNPFLRAGSQAEESCSPARLQGCGLHLVFVRWHLLTRWLFWLPGRGNGPKLVPCEGTYSPGRGHRAARTPGLSVLLLRARATGSAVFLHLVYIKMSSPLKSAFNTNMWKGINGQTSDAWLTFCQLTSCSKAGMLLRGTSYSTFCAHMS